MLMEMGEENARQRGALCERDTEMNKEKEEERR